MNTDKANENEFVFLIPPSLGPCIGSIRLKHHKGDTFHIEMKLWIAFEYSKGDFPSSDFKLFFRYKQAHTEWKTITAISEMQFPSINQSIDFNKFIDVAKIEPMRQLSYINNDVFNRNTLSYISQEIGISGGVSIIQSVADEIEFLVNRSNHEKKYETIEFQIFLIRDSFSVDTIDLDQVIHLHKKLEPSKWNDEIDRWLLNDIARCTTAGKQPSAPPWMGAEKSTWAQRATVKLSEETLRALIGDGESIRFIGACCRHPGMGLDEERMNESLKRASKASAAFAMLVGDQIYADATAGLNDPINPIERYVEEHAKAFGPEGYGQLTRKMPVYFTADDHEWRDDYPNGIPLDIFTINNTRYKSVANHAVSAFQYSHVSTNSDFSYRIENYHLLDVFVFDTRSNRHRGGSDINSSNEILTLLNWIRSTPESLKLKVLVSGSVLLPGLFPDSDVSKPGYLDTTQLYPVNRLAVLTAIADASEQGSRFLLLSGDYHLSGFFELKCNEKTIGACTVVPPWYAPWLFSNSSPYQVMTDEVIGLPLAAGVARRLTLEQVPGGQLLSGNGFSEFSVEPVLGSSTKTFKISVQRNLLDMTLPDDQNTIRFHKASTYV